MKRILLITMILLLAAPIFAKDIKKMDYEFSYIPPPELLYPIGGEVALTGQAFLGFKWSPHEGVSGSRDYYDFRLYKGYNMNEGALLLKVRVPGDIYQYNVNSDRFQDGQVYTWALKQVYNPLRQSDWRYISFKAVKRD
jgi:hypothetical protein